MNRNQVIIVCVVALGAIGLALGYFVFVPDLEGSQKEKKTVVAEKVLSGEKAPVMLEQSQAEEEESDLSRFLSSSVKEEGEEMSPPAEDAPVKERFEYILTNMLKDMASKASEYKKKRKVMKELIVFDNKDHIEENFLLLQDLSNDLYKEADEVMGVFEQADQEVRALVGGESEEEQKVVWDGWQALKKDKAGVYQKFFMVERDLIQAYNRLLRFYFIKRPFFTIDEETQELTFEKENDQKLASKLKLQISRLERVQATLITRH